MSNLTEKIQAADEDLLKQKDALVNSTSLLEASPDDEVLLNEVTELSNKVEKATDTLSALKKAETALAAKAEAVVAPKVVKSQHLGSPDSKDLFFKHATAKMIAFANKQTVDQVLEERYADQSHVKATFDYVAKTAVDPALTSTSGWAAELVQDSTQGFLETLKTTSVAAALASKSQNLNFGGYNSITIPRRNPLGANPTEPAWVAEASPIPLTQYDFGSETINRYKLAAITTMSKEITQRSTPAIEGLLRSALSESYSVVLDNALLSSLNKVEGVRPAGLRYNISTAAGDSSGGSEALIQDLKDMLAFFTANRTGSRPVLIMNNLTKLNISMMQSSLSDFLYRDEISSGRILGMEVISSDNVPEDICIMVDADSFVSAMDTPTFDVSEVATVAQNNADATIPTMAGASDGTVGTAGEVPPSAGAHISGSTGAAYAGTVSRSLWQTYSVGIRLLAPTSWAMIRPNSIVERTALTW
jgi:HK97 family phage major capsid protein